MRPSVSEPVGWHSAAPRGEGIAHEPLYTSYSTIGRSVNCGRAGVGEACIAPSTTPSPGLHQNAYSVKHRALRRRANVPDPPAGGSAVLPGAGIAHWSLHKGLLPNWAKSLVRR